MSNDTKFTFTTAQLTAMEMLSIEDQHSFLNGAVQSKLISALTYQRKKIEDEAQENYNRTKSYLKSMKIDMPEDFGSFKARLMAEVQSALDELGYTPNKKKGDDKSE